MFSGETQEIELICENSIVEEILDRFGNTAKVSKAQDDEHFKVSVKAVVSDGLVAWIMQYGIKIEVCQPQILRSKVREKAIEICKKYEADAQCGIE